MAAKRAVVQRHRPSEKLPADLAFDPSQAAGERQAQSKRREVPRPQTEEGRGRTRAAAPEQPGVNRKTPPPGLGHRSSRRNERTEDSTNGDDYGQRDQSPDGKDTDEQREAYLKQPVSLFPHWH
jgi:hypothetical protein